jgi:hypothetical protein
MYLCSNTGGLIWSTGVRNAPLRADIGQPAIELDAGTRQGH